MEAIDFKKLLREERKRAKQKKKEQVLQKDTEAPSNKATEKQDSIDHSSGNEEKKVVDARYNWEYPDGFLGFRELSLATICENPRSISYSSSVLESQILEGVPDASRNQAEIDESKGSGSPLCPPTRSTTAKLRRSPGAALVDWLQKLPSGDSGMGEWKVMSYGKRRVCMFGENTDGSSCTLPTPLAEIAHELVNREVFPPSASPPPNHVLLNEYQPGQGILPHTDGPRYEDRTATLSLGSDVVIEFTKRLASSEIGGSSSKRATIVGDSDRGDRYETKQAETNFETVTEKDNANNALLHSKSTGDPSSPSVSPIQILLESGSLLVFEGDAYMNYCHGINMDVWSDVTTDYCLNAPSGKIVPRGLRYSLTFRHKKSDTKQVT